MILAPSRKLWTPWDDAKRKWQRFLTKFQEGKLQRGPSGKLRRNANGKLVRNSADSQACCCGESVYKVLTCCDDADEGVYVRGTPGTTYVIGGSCYYIPDDALPESPEPDPGDIVVPTDIRESCDVCAFTRSKKCSDDSYSDIWVPGCPQLLYFRQAGTCYYTDVTHQTSVSGTDPGSTAYNPSGTFDDCDDCCCPTAEDITSIDWTLSFGGGLLAMETSCGGECDFFLDPWGGSTTGFSTSGSASPDGGDYDFSQIVYSLGASFTSNTGGPASDTCGEDDCPDIFYPHRAGVNMLASIVDCQLSVTFIVFIQVCCGDPHENCRWGCTAVEVIELSTELCEPTSGTVSATSPDTGTFSWSISANY